VQYVVSPAGDSLSVTVDPPYGNFQLNAFCQATDSAGQRREPSAYLVVQTHQITFGDGWDMALADCARAFQRWWRDHVRNFVPQLPLPDDAPRVNPAERFGLVGLAAEPQLLAEAALGATAGGKAGLSVLRNLRTSHGPALVGALAWYTGFHMQTQALPAVAFSSRRSGAEPAQKPSTGFAGQIAAQGSPPRKGFVRRLFSWLFRRG
jgi:hypothetical protein